MQRADHLCIAPDLLFLDVEMPGGSGFDLLLRLGSWPFEVIFCTGFQRYAIQAIRFSALDYLAEAGAAGRAFCGAEPFP
jgi:DNA-binding LytR/AlgR family response regulator